MYAWSNAHIPFDPSIAISHIQNLYFSLSLSSWERKKLQSIVVEMNLRENFKKYELINKTAEEEKSEKKKTIEFETKNQINNKTKEAKKTNYSIIQ